MNKILITEFMDESFISEIKDKFETSVDFDCSTDSVKLSNLINRVDGIIVRNKTQLTREVLEFATSLKFIGRLGVGLDNIDTEYCVENNIHVQTATGMNADSVAEYVISSTLSLLKNTPVINIETQKGNWPRNKIKSRELKDKTLGLIGFGMIGRKVAELSKIFGAKVFVYDPYINEKAAERLDVNIDSFESILKNADVISLHTPLTKETANLINKDTISLMNKSPIIINSSRGGIIQQNDLIEGYISGKISGFSLDVYDSEPVNEGFLKKIKPTFNCILSPHNAGVTEESNIRVSKFITEKLIEFFD